MVLGRAAPLGAEIDAVVVRVPSHVVPVHMGRHRQWRRHLHARSLVLIRIYSILAFGFSAACSLSRPPYVVRWCRMRPSFSHSSGTTHIALSLTGSGSSCSSFSTSVIALVALESFHTSHIMYVPSGTSRFSCEIRTHFCGTNNYHGGPAGSRERRPERGPHHAKGTRYVGDLFGRPVAPH